MARSQMMHGSEAGPSPWALAGLSDGAAHQLEQWLDGLCNLTLDEWCAIGRACARQRATNADEGAALDALDDVIQRQRLALTAWYVRDLVNTAAYAARREAEHTSRARRRELSAAIAAAERAALAIALHPSLGAADSARLRGPFALGGEPPELRLV